jgi:TDG/mug DNA glycosylase family protein
VCSHCKLPVVPCLFSRTITTALCFHPCTPCGDLPAGCVCGTCGAPALVAFTGKRHYQELLKLDANGNMLTKQQLKMCRQQQQAAQQGQPTQSTMLMFGTGAAASRKRKAALEGQGAEKQEVVTAAGTSSPNQQQAQAAGALTSPDGIHTAAAAITQVAAASGSGAGSGATAAPAAAAATGVPFGPQTHLPDGWPLPPATEVWVLTSTSGACPLTHEQREEPYRRLAARLAEIPWPRADLPRCCSRAAAEQV